MKLSLRPDKSASGPVAGLLVRGECPEHWLRAIQGCGLRLSETDTFLVPGADPRRPWGCIFICPSVETSGIGPAVTVLYRASSRLMIPAGAALVPLVPATELDTLLPEGLHLLHPSIGLLPLELSFDWSARLEVSVPAVLRHVQPVAPVFRPERILRYEVAAPDANAGLEAMDARIREGGTDLTEKPLSLLEKLRLSVYRMLFKDLPEGSPGGRDPNWLQRALRKLLGGSRIGFPPASEMLTDYDALERRNASEMEKLLRMLREDPANALKYAVPISDEPGRGMPGTFHLSKIWSNFRLFGDGGWGGFGGSDGFGMSGGGGFSIGEDQRTRLIREYNQSAEALIANGDYERAAFIYLRLLKNYQQAAVTLEKGGLFAEAAAVHEQHTKDKMSAARCYEQATMLSKAVTLYDELGAHEQAGDIYDRLYETEKAQEAFGKASTAFVSKRKFIDAARISRVKMGDAEQADRLLLEGWRKRCDSEKCLSTYLEAIPDEEDRLHAIHRLRREDVDGGNYRSFLTVLRAEAKAAPALRPPVRDIATGIIAERVSGDPTLISELRFFDEENAMIMRDILRYKSRKNRAS